MTGESKRERERKAFMPEDISLSLSLFGIIPVLRYTHHIRNPSSESRSDDTLGEMPVFYEERRREIEGKRERETNAL